MGNTTAILQDSFGRQHNYLRISLIEKCNLRCTYCMPEEGVMLTPREQLMTAKEIIAIARIFVENGVDKIRLTGGEPLLRKDFSEIAAALSELPVRLSITTNAILVDRYLEDFKKYRIWDINASLDTLKTDKFRTITKRDQFHRAFNNINKLIEEDFNVKLNVVLMNNFNQEEITDFIALTQDRKLSVRFIEFMPFDGNQWNKSKLVSEREILDRANAFFGESRVERLPNEKNFTARNYQVSGFKGNFGIISSVTNPFCDSCNRIRLTANGTIKNCLFSNNETNLLETFRNGGKIEPLIQNLLLKKKAVRAGMNTSEKLENPENHSNNRSMITIGG
ncbi:GTP 3',8-cyclase MoaA [Flavimarina sp. Hel_I_48]|uniref:GTP 3',8-cyclase MoaA n=1 Tax=Flavimarina sp. Hel_I_48 TaxID=1392488 RepID=UPI0004DF0F39|nr:GTP 3',8-cyclase MoaA [Flavimarina sp. Hel_I_48]